MQRKPLTQFWAGLLSVVLLIAGCSGGGRTDSPASPHPISTDTSRAIVGVSVQGLGISSVTLKAGTGETYSVGTSATNVLISKSRTQLLVAIDPSGLTRGFVLSLPNNPNREAIISPRNNLRALFALSPGIFTTDTSMLRQRLDGIEASACFSTLAASLSARQASGISLDSIALDTAWTSARVACATAAQQEFRAQAVAVPRGNMNVATNATSGSPPFEVRLTNTGMRFVEVRARESSCAAQDAGNVRQVFSSMAGVNVAQKWLAGATPASALDVGLTANHQHCIDYWVLGSAFGTAGLTPPLDVGGSASTATLNDIRSGIQYVTLPILQTYLPDVIDAAGAGGIVGCLAGTAGIRTAQTSGGSSQAFELVHAILDALNACAIGMVNDVLGHVIDFYSTFVPLVHEIEYYQNQSAAYPKASMARIYAPVASISVSPQDATIKQGQTVTLGAVVRDDAGNLAPEAAGLHWTISDQNGLELQSSSDVGVTIRALSIGTYSVRVSLGSIVGVAHLTVVAAPASPTISLSSTSASFSTAVGINPAAQSINVTNGGTGALTGLSAAVSYQASQSSGWLVALLYTSSAPSSLTLTPATGILAAGTYNAVVSVVSTSAGVTNSPTTIAVTLVVTAATTVPSIALSTSSVAFSATVGGSNAAPQNISITNGGTGTLSGLAASVSYQTGQSPGWLSASLITTTAPATLTLATTVGALAAGTYGAAVSIASTAAGVMNSPRAVMVSLTVRASATGSLVLKALLSQCLCFGHGMALVTGPQGLLNGGTPFQVPVLDSLVLTGLTPFFYVVTWIDIVGAGPLPGSVFTYRAHSTVQGANVTSSGPSVSIESDYNPITGALFLGVRNLGAGRTAQAVIMGPDGSPISGSPVTVPQTGCLDCSVYLANNFKPGLYTVTWQPVVINGITLRAAPLAQVVGPGISAQRWMGDYQP